MTFHLGSFAINFGLLLWIAFTIYALGVTVVILMDNRTPQASFAWLFLMLALPLVGVVVYYFFGRGHKAFSSEEKLARIGMQDARIPEMDYLQDMEDEYIQRIAWEKPESYRRRLLHLVRCNSASTITAYNDVEILQNASEKYPRLMEDIRNAHHSIHLLYYIWTEDEFTLSLKDVLVEKARSGVKVRALIDAANFVVSQQYQDDLLSAGVDVRPYKVYRRLTQLHNVNYRSHRKIAVIDGKIGYIGGMNLDREQLPGGHPLGDWRDTHLRIDGEAALALQSSFAISWFNTTGESITSSDYFPPVRPGARPFIPVQITQSGPDSQWKAMQQLYFFMIMAAEKSVFIQSPFFIPDEGLLDAIKAAALSGVDVRIICTPRGAFYQVPYRAAYTYYADVARAGARVYLYDRGYFHPKTITIDSAVCAIGTANIDIRSFYLNYEAMAVIYDRTMARELEADFMEDQRNSIEWRLDEYERSPGWRRLLDSVYRLTSPIL